MPVMSAIEAAFCRSSPWRAFAHRRVLPWALDSRPLAGEVLEVGCGSGAMAAGVARTYPDVRLTVTDVDDAMVDAARDRLTRFPNVKVVKADVTSLPFESAGFDAVTSYLMLHHVIDWVDALAEIARVIRPGGAFMGYDLTNTVLARAVHRVDGSPYRIIGRAELADGLAVAGFTDITIRPSALSHLMRFHARRRSGSSA